MTGRATGGVLMGLLLEVVVLSTGRQAHTSSRLEVKDVHDGAGGGGIVPPPPALFVRSGAGDTLPGDLDDAAGALLGRRVRR
ncbi:hypothetical protein Stube_48780 [Streptomyces tubercidicus]|uniref:Uncharacterized protein n=1 Tax=Streptomyces tubercidicus TaxID=47759 RepID=A0A640UZZ2_9ACTN|nr:hypothetical protein Stube_48780 [Streptomyces tubercidicus]